MSIEQFVLAYNHIGDYMKFQRIRDLREDADLTQTEMDKAINLPQRTYAYYESGETIEVVVKTRDSGYEEQIFSVTLGSRKSAGLK